MIVVNEDSIISGNTALQPKYNPSIDIDEENKELKKKKLKQKKIKQRRLNDKIKFMRNVVVMFIIGIVLVARYSSIYSMQMELSDIKSNINKVNRENQNLTVELVGYNNLQYIEDTAINRLHMVAPDKKNAVYIDLQKNVLKYTEKKKGEQQQNIWNRLKKMLF